MSVSPLAHTSRHVYAVSTTSRGIGAEFARQLLVRTSDTKVIALARNTATEKLYALQQSYPQRLSVVKVDLEDQQSVDAAAVAIAGQTDRLDLLINVAGILGDGATTPGPERSLGGIDRDWLRKTMEINLVGHVMMTKGLLPLLKKPKAGPSQLQEVARVVNLSARVGSIGDNGLGGWYSYRMSKAALNQVDMPFPRSALTRNDLSSLPPNSTQFTKTASVELKRANVLTMSIHPGTTDTDLSIPFQKNVQPDKLFTVEYSVGCMLDVIWSRTLTDTGKFYAYDGTEIPW